MKKFIFLFLFLLISSKAFATLSVVQTKATNPVDNADSSAATFVSTPTAGNLIVVTVFGWRTPGAGGFRMASNAVTDNKGNTYTQAVQSALDPTNSNVSTSIFYAYNITSSATFTITVDPTGVGNYFSWAASEVSGATTGDPLDKTTSNTGTNATAPSTGSTTATSQANEIVFAVHVNDVTQTSITVDTFSPVFTELMENLDAANHIPGESDYRVISASGTQSCSWTLASASPWSASIATFKDPSANVDKVFQNMTVTGGLIVQ